MCNFRILSETIFFVSVPIYKYHNVPTVIDKFVNFMFEKNSLNRSNANEAALICQVLFWATRAWTSRGISSQDIYNGTLVGIV